jgi:hypothetical protein
LGYFTARKLGFRHEAKPSKGVFYSSGSRNLFYFTCKIQKSSWRDDKILATLPENSQEKYCNVKFCCVDLCKTIPICERVNLVEIVIALTADMFVFFESGEYRVPSLQLVVRIIRLFVKSLSG